MCIDLGPALAISNPYIPIGWILNTKVREGRLSDCKRPCPRHQPASAEGKLELSYAWL